MIAGGEVEQQVQAVQILSAVSQAKRDFKAGRLSREQFFETVDDLGVAWRALFRGYALLEEEA
jgi:hypothetical protein